MLESTSSRAQSSPQESRSHETRSHDMQSKRIHSQDALSHGSQQNTGQETRADRFQQSLLTAKAANTVGLLEPATLDALSMSAANSSAIAARQNSATTDSSRVVFPDSVPISPISTPPSNPVSRPTRLPTNTPTNTDSNNPVAAPSSSAVLFPGNTATPTVNTPSIDTSPLPNNSSVRPDSASTAQSNDTPQPTNAATRQPFLNGSSPNIAILDVQFGPMSTGILSHGETVKGVIEQQLKNTDVNAKISTFLIGRNREIRDFADQASSQTPFDYVNVSAGPNYTTDDTSLHDPTISQLIADYNQAADPASRIQTDINNLSNEEKRQLSNAYVNNESYRSRPRILAAAIFHALSSGSDVYNAAPNRQGIDGIYTLFDGFNDTLSGNFYSVGSLDQTVGESFANTSAQNVSQQPVPIAGYSATYGVDLYTGGEVAANYLPGHQVTSTGNSLASPEAIVNDIRSRIR